MFTLNFFQQQISYIFLSFTILSCFFLSASEHPTDRQPICNKTPIVLHKIQAPKIIEVPERKIAVPNPYATYILERKSTPIERTTIKRAELPEIPKVSNILSKEEWEIFGKIAQEIQSKDLELMHAVATDNIEKAEALLEQGANPNFDFSHELLITMVEQWLKNNPQKVLAKP